MANAETSTVSLYIREKNKAGKWAFVHVDDRSKKLKPILTEGEARYYISWYEDGKKKFLNVGCALDEARTQLTNRRNGMEAEQIQKAVNDADAADKTSIDDAIGAYFRELRIFKGKDGMGKSEKTIQAYERRLELFSEFCGERELVYLEQITRDHLLSFVEWLQDEKRDLSDRSVWNVFGAAQTFLKKRGITVGAGILSQLDFAEPPVKAYTKEQLKTLFAQCD